MNLTHERLNDLATCWTQQGAPVVEHLRPGLANIQIARMVEQLELRLPAEAVAWWSWRDGVAPVHERTMGGADFEFLPLQEAVDLYRVQRRIAVQATEGTIGFRLAADELWHPNWFPLTVTRYGGVITCDCGVDDHDHTPIRVVIGGETPTERKRVRIDSLGAMVDGWIDALDRGAWRYDRTERRWLLDYSRLEDPTRELTRLV